MSPRDIFARFMLGSVARPARDMGLCTGAVLACLAVGCSSSSNGSAVGLDGAVSDRGPDAQGLGTEGLDAGGSRSSDGSGGAGAGTDARGPLSMATIPVPDGGVPAAPAQTTLPLSTAAALGEVDYLPNRSSVRLYVPGIAGARDYRVFAVESGVTVNVGAGNREHVSGATITCAGLRQRNQCCDDEILPVTYNNSLLDMPRCEMYSQNRRPNVPKS